MVIGQIMYRKGAVTVTSDVEHLRVAQKALHVQHDDGTVGTKSKWFIGIGCNPHEKIRWLNEAFDSRLQAEAEVSAIICTLHQTGHVSYLSDNPFIDFGGE